MESLGKSCALVATLALLTQATDPVSVNQWIGHGNVKGAYLVQESL